MHKRLYDIKEIKSTPSQIVFGLYSRNFGSEGGWHLLQTFIHKEKAEEYLIMLVSSNGKAIA